MKAIIVKAPGGLDLLERIELPDPGPLGPGANQGALACKFAELP